MKQSIIKSFILLLLTGCSLCAWSQNSSTRSQVRTGNRAYGKQHYDQAETAYRKALKSDSTYYKAQYNMGNAQYRQKNYAEAAQHYGAALQYPKLSDKQKSSIYHNQGNSFLQQGLADRQNGMQAFAQAVNSYQEALKLNPKNEDTRYNLSYAKKLLQQAQQNQQNQQNQQQQQQNQDQQQNQQNQDKKEQQDQQQQQQQQNKDQQGQKDQDQKSNRDQKKQDPKKQDAERLLEAVRNNEKETLKEQNKKLEQVRGLHIEKDW